VRASRRYYFLHFVHRKLKPRLEDDFKGYDCIAPMLERAARVLDADFDDLLLQCPDGTDGDAVFQHEWSVGEACRLG
jgi:hypothetical protein